MGSFHDTISCPFRYLLCSRCGQVGHNVSLCSLKKLEEKNNFENFWFKESQPKNQERLYKRVVPTEKLVLD